MSNFIGLVYATLQKEGIDTTGMSTDEAVKKYNKLQGKSGNSAKEQKQTSKELTPNESKPLKELGVDDTKEENKKRPTQSRTLEQQVDKVLDGTYKDSHITISEETPQVLQSIGVPNKPMLMTAKHAYLAINKEGKYTGKDDHYHDLGKELFLQIPKFLERPTMVLQSSKDKNELLAILNWRDKQGNMLIAPIKLNAKGTKDYIRIETNLVKSAYGRENLKNYINKNFSQDDIVLYGGNKKIRDIYK